MVWFAHRTRLESITHGVFNEPAVYTPPAEVGGDPVSVVGVLSDGSRTEELTDETGYEATETVYEVRKAADEGPFTADSFDRLGTLTLDSGQAYTVIYVIQTDTLLFLGLAAVEE